MTYTSHANSRVSSMAILTHLTSTHLSFGSSSPSSPPPPPSHTTSMQSYPPSLPSLITTVSLYHCVLRLHLLAQHCYPSHPIHFVFGQSDSTVDEHRWQFTHHCFPHLHAPVNHQTNENTMLTDISIQNYLQSLLSCVSLMTWAAAPACQMLRHHNCKQ